MLHATISLTTLHCITPTDPSGEDEPYLWAFFIRTDGTTVRQSSVTPGRLSANVEVTSGPGRPGNLNEAKAVSGSNIHIPPAVGVHSSPVLPIPLLFTRNGVTFRFFVPGALSALVVAIDEDSAPRDAMQTAHDDVRTLLKQRLDDFFNGLDLQPAFDQAGTVVPNPTVSQVFQAALTNILTTITTSLTQFLNGTPAAPGGLVKEVIDAAIQSAEIATMADAGFFDQLAGALDPDEPVGAALVRLTDVEIIQANLGLESQSDLRQSSSGLGGAWYVLHDAKSASLVLGEIGDMATTSAAPQQMETGVHVFTGEKLCLPDGPVQWTRMGHVQTYDVSIPYPFIAYQYVLDGQPLTGANGVAKITTEVHFPDFDPTTYSFAKNRSETHTAQVSFTRVRQPFDQQIEHLRLTNDPQDGNYFLTLEVHGVLPNGATVPAGVYDIVFQGQTIQLPKDFLDGIKQCLAPFTSNRFSKSKHVGPKDLWGPYGRWERYEEIAQVIDARAAVTGHDPRVADAVKAALAKQLKVQPAQQGAIL